MPEIKIGKAFRVDVIESERGWGRKIDETKYFDNKEEALAFVEQFNKRNDKDYVPDWYEYAEYVGELK